MERDLSSVKVSVIVPVYNAEKYISKCFDSLVNQSLKDIEIIVIDDGSTDKTPEIIKDYASKDERIKIITQTNQKQGAARNRGLEIAQGEYVTFVDADDWIDGDYLEKMYIYAHADNADLAISTSIREKGNKQRYHLHFTQHEIFDDFDTIIKVLNMHWEPHSKIYKADIAKSLKFEECVYFEDGRYIIRFLHKTKRMITVPDTAYHYVSNPNSTIKRKASVATKLDRIEAAIDIIDYAEKNNIKIPEYLIFKEDKKLFSIKYYKNKRIYYLFGIKIFEKKTLFDNSKLFLVFANKNYESLLCNIKRIFVDSNIILVTEDSQTDLAKNYADQVLCNRDLLNMIRQLPSKKIFCMIPLQTNCIQKLIFSFIKPKYILKIPPDNTYMNNYERDKFLLKQISHRQVKDLSDIANDKP